MESKSVIKILSWNIKGFKETIDGTKKNKFIEKEVIDILSSYDIVFCLETHLDRESAKDITLPGFAAGVHYCRPKRAQAHKASGGISVFVKEYLRDSIKFMPQSTSDIVWLMTKTSNINDQDTYIGCVYAPPEFSTYGRDYTRTIWDQLERETELFCTKGNVILCGDFNARTGTLVDFIQMDGENNVCDIPSNYTCDYVHKRSSMDKVVQKYGRKFVRLCVDNNMYILNGRTLGDLQGNATCYSPNGKSVVDYFTCSQELMRKIVKCQVKNLTIFSDHCPIELYVQLPIRKGSSKNICSSSRYSHTKKEAQDNYKTSQPSQNNYSFVWEEDSAEKLTSAFQTVLIANRLDNINEKLDTATCQNTPFSKEKIDNSVADLTNTILDAAKLSVKCKNKCTKKKNNKPSKRWFSQQCFAQRKEVRSLLNAMNRSPFNRNIQNKYFSALKTYKRTIKKTKQTYRNKLVSSLNTAMEHDPKKVWNILRELKNIDGSPQSLRYTLNAAKWINHLENLISREVSVDERRKDLVQRELNNTVQQSIPEQNLEKAISVTEVLQAVKSLKCNKAPGKDGLTGEMLKASMSSICTVISKLFNIILQSGNYPSQWKDGINVPIFKSGDQTNPNNYRGITLTSSLGKLFCIVINKRIETHLQNNNLLIKEQAGFRKHSRTTDHIFILKKIIDHTIAKKNGRLYSCFVDFNKAFDNIWHDALLVKLNRLRINGKCFRIIQDMYTDSTVCGKTSQGFTNPIPVKKGVLQGNILSPTLFNVFINDIKNAINDNTSPFINETTKTQIPCLLYADDIVLLSTTKLGLQNKLDQLQKYCQDWGLKINREKTKVVIFTKSDPKIPLLFSCGDNFIETVDKYKYLGVIFHKRGHFHCAEEHLAKQGNKAAYALKRSVRGKELNVDVMMSLFDTLITPILSYGAEVWLPFTKPVTNATLQSILDKQFSAYISPNCPTENVHIKFCRSLLGVHKRTMKLPVLAELGRYPISLNALCQTITFWIHITESDEDSYLRQAYNDMLLAESHNNAIWLKFVKNILLSMGFSHVWENQGTLNVKRLKYSIQNKLQEKYLQYWTSVKNGISSRLSFYNKIVCDYGLQPYLISCKNSKHRTALCRLRLSSHELAIEQGRYYNTPKHERLCKLCRVLEDEYHFLDMCSMYDKLRSTLIMTVSSSSQPSYPSLATVHNSAPYQTPSSLLLSNSAQPELARYVYECLKVRSQYVSPSAN